MKLLKSIEAFNKADNEIRDYFGGLKGGHISTEELDMFWKIEGNVLHVSTEEEVNGNIEFLVSSYDIQYKGSDSLAIYRKDGYVAIGVLMPEDEEGVYMHFILKESMNKLVITGERYDEEY
jgi:hypothetical protein